LQLSRFSPPVGAFFARLPRRRNPYISFGGQKNHSTGDKNRFGSKIQTTSNMKKSIFLICAACAALTAGADSYPVELPADTVKVIGAVETRDDTVRVRAGRTNVVVIDRGNGKTEVTAYRDPKRVHTATEHKNDKFFSLNVPIVDIGFNNYDSRNIVTGADGGYDFLPLNTAKSWNAGIYAFTSGIKLTRDRSLMLHPALGVEWNNFRFEQGWTIASINGYTEVTSKYLEELFYGGPPPRSLVSKSKLTTVYLNLPLMLRWNIMMNDKPSFYIEGGVIGGMRLGSHTKAKYLNGGGKDKVRESFNLNMLTWDLTLRAGYRNFGVFANYQMNPMFRKGHGPELYPYSAGLSFAINR
jgi:hypothetical protein